MSLPLPPQFDEFQKKIAALKEKRLALEAECERIEAAYQDLLRQVTELNEKTQVDTIQHNLQNIS